MLSSPPRGTSPRPLPSSPAASDYELDLDALEGSSLSSSPVVERNIPQVLSEDIDGPSDFTINMMDWMKGGRASGRNDIDNSVAITSGTPSIFRNNAPHLQPTVEDYSSPARPSNPTPLGGRTPASERSPAGNVGRPDLLSPVQPPGGAPPHLVRQIEQLRSELAAEKEKRAAEKATHAAEIERMGAQHVKELQAATSELRATRDAHSNEIHRMSVEYSQQLRTAYETAANDARKMEAVHDADMESAQAELNSIHAEHEKKLKAAASASGDCKSSCATEIARLKAQHIEQTKALSKALTISEAERATETARLRSEHAKELQAATSGATGLKASHAAEMQRISNEHKTSHAAEIQRITTEHKTNHAAEIQRITIEHKSRDAAKDAAIYEKVHARELRYKQKVASRDTKLVERNTEVEELRSKLEHMEKMYKNMGTELMRAWGREEFGDTGEKQRFRYKYAKATAA